MMNKGLAMSSTQQMVLLLAGALSMHPDSMMAMHASFSKGKNTYLILLFGAGLSFRRAFCYNRIAFCLRDVVRRLFCAGSV